MPLTPSDFGTIQTAAHFDLDSLRTKSQRLFNGFSHRAPKCNSLFQLRRNLFGLQLSIQFRLVYFLNRYQHFASGFRRQIALQFVDLSTLTTDDDAGSRGVDDD